MINFIMKWSVFVAIGIAPSLVGHSVLEDWYTWAYIIIMVILVELHKISD